MYRTVTMHCFEEPDLVEECGLRVTLCSILASRIQQDNLKLRNGDSAWEMHGECVETMWRLYGDSVESVWRRCGERVESVAP